MFDDIFSDIDSICEEEEECDCIGEGTEDNDEVGFAESLAGKWNTGKDKWNSKKAWTTITPEWSL